MRMHSARLVIWFYILLMVISCQETEPIYKDPNVAVDARVEDLLERMTMEEKFFQLFMIPGDLKIGKEQLRHGIFGLQTSAMARNSGEAGQMLAYHTAGSARLTAEKINEIQAFFLEETRLGIPIIAFDESLHGLVREGATAFPQAIGLAATWNTDLMSEVAAAIAAETHSRGIRQVLSPVVNIARDPRWGRVEETYGEDPYLSAQMGKTFVTEFETRGVVTTPKHFVANYGDGGRDSYPRHLSERELEEVYFPAFKACIGPGGSRSVMTAYNSLNGAPCTANDWLLNKKLKQEWGFEGFVISDAGAVGGLLDLHHIVADREGSAKVAIENGLDVIFQTDYAHHIPLLNAFTSGQVDQEAIDRAVKRVLKVKFELGLFEDPYADPEQADVLNGSGDHLDLARRAARESMVLLKNKNGVLPLKKGLRSILVVGSDAVEARLGGYSGPGTRKISILEGIKAAVPASCEVLYTEGVSRRLNTYATIPATYLFNPSKTGVGLHASYFSNPNLAGSPEVSRTESEIDHSWTLSAPDPLLQVDWFSARWEGIMEVPFSGIRHIGVEANDGVRLYINGELVIDRWIKQSYGVYTIPYLFKPGSNYKIRLEFKETDGNGRIRLVWDGDQAGHPMREIEKAKRLAVQSDIVIIVAGIEEGEFRDRSDLRLPGLQETLITTLAESEKPVIVILIGGSAITMGAWLEQAEGVIMAWYPGEQGGHAVGDVLTGKYNPGGKLPITFPQTVAQVPLYYNHKPTGRGDDYNDLSGEPLFPFGFGLSYTTFEFRDLSVWGHPENQDDTVKVALYIKNTGQMVGEEVPQVYISHQNSKRVRAVKQLVGFERIRIAPGEEKYVEMILSPDLFMSLDQDMRAVFEPGIYTILVGNSSRQIQLQGRLKILE